MDHITIHCRVTQRHPELSAEDIAHAWVNRIAEAQRDVDPSQLVVVGFDCSGRMLEMVAVELEDGDYLVFHAMTPPSKKTLRESRLI